MKLSVIILSLFMFGSISCMHHRGSHHQGMGMMKMKRGGHHTCALCNKKDKSDCDCHKNKKKKYRSQQKKGMHRYQKKDMHRPQSHHKRGFHKFKRHHPLD